MMSSLSQLSSNANVSNSVEQASLSNCSSLDFEPKIEINLHTFFLSLSLPLREANMSWVLIGLQFALIFKTEDQGPDTCKLELITRDTELMAHLAQCPQLRLETDKVNNSQVDMRELREHL